MHHEPKVYLHPADQVFPFQKEYDRTEKGSMKEKKLQVWNKSYQSN